MSLALFEDDFLNKFIAFKDEDNRTPPESYSLPKFNSVNSYVRWDENLFDAMKLLPKQSDKIFSFLYPDTWNVKETSNKYKPNRDLYVNSAGEPDYPGDKQITQYDKQRKRMPLRELFIRTSIIIEAFETSST